LRRRWAVGAPHRRIEVVVVWNEVSGVEPENGWPAGWFDATNGAIDDPSFERAPQGAVERRDDLP
jgi:hypothetical protein